MCGEEGEKDKSKVYIEKRDEFSKKQKNRKKLWTKRKNKFKEKKEPLYLKESRVFRFNY